MSKSTHLILGTKSTYGKGYSFATLAHNVSQTTSLCSKKENIFKVFNYWDFYSYRLPSCGTSHCV